MNNEYICPEKYKDYDKSQRVMRDILKILIKSDLTYNDYNLVMETIRNEIKFHTYVNIEL